MAAPTGPSPPRPRVLVVEDNFLIGEFMRQILDGLDYVVVGPVPTLGEALLAIETVDLDGALIDVQIGDETAAPAAEELASRGVPFILTTGRGSRAGLPAVLANAPLLAKPFEVWQLEAMVAAMFQPRVNVGPR